MLREGPDGSASTRPLPTLGDVPALVEESRRAGVRVRAEYRVPELGSAPRRPAGTPTASCRSG